MMDFDAIMHQALVEGAPMVNKALARFDAEEKTVRLDDLITPEERVLMETDMVLMGVKAASLTVEVELGLFDHAV